MKAFAIFIKTEESVQKRIWNYLKQQCEAALRFTEQWYVVTYNGTAKTLKESIRDQVRPNAIVVFGLNKTISAFGFQKELYDWFDENMKKDPDEL